MNVTTIHYSPTPTRIFSACYMIIHLFCRKGDAVDHAFGAFKQAASMNKVLFDLINFVVKILVSVHATIAMNTSLIKHEVLMLLRNRM